MHGKKKGRKNGGSVKKSISEVSSKKQEDLPDQDSESTNNSSGKRSADNINEVPEKKRKDKKEHAKNEESESAENSVRRTKRATTNNVAEAVAEKKSKEMKVSRESSERSKAEPEKKTKSKEYEVEAIMDQRKNKGIEEFFIKWKGYSENESTWEPKSNLNCKRLLDDFLKAKK